MSTPAPNILGEKYLLIISVISDFDIFRITVTMVLIISGISLPTFSVVFSIMASNRLSICGTANSIGLFIFIYHPSIRNILFHVRFSNAPKVSFIIYQSLTMPIFAFSITPSPGPTTPNASMVTRSWLGM